MGKKSRTKGRRGEQQLVLHLASLGYKAKRILDQYATQGLPDVRLTTENGVEMSLELKCRKEEFKSIYQLYYGSTNTWSEKGGALVRCELSTGPVVLCTDIRKVISAGESAVEERFPKPRTAEKLRALRHFLGIADILVLKNDRCRFLFLRFL